MDAELVETWEVRRDVCNLEQELWTFKEASKFFSEGHTSAKVESHLTHSISQAVHSFFIFHLSCLSILYITSPTYQYATDSDCALAHSSYLNRTSVLQALRAKRSCILRHLDFPI